MNNAIRKSLFLTCGLFVSSLLAASDATSPLVDFSDEWAGPGNMFGSEVAVNLSWTPALDGSFSTIHVVYRSQDDSQPFVFEGIGYYRADSGTRFSGTWFDSQSNMHPLQAELQDGTLTTSWGTASTELGQSVYRLLENGHLEVIDSAQDENGELQAFARSTLARQ